MNIFLKKLCKTVLITAICGAVLLSPAMAFYYKGPSDWAFKEVRAAIDSGFPNPETDDTAGFPSWNEGLILPEFQNPIRRLYFSHIIGCVLAKDKNMDSCMQYDEIYNKGYIKQFADLHRVFYNSDAYLVSYYGIIDPVNRNKFGADGFVTREQAAEAVVKTVKALRPSLWQDGKNYSADKKITDRADISQEEMNCVGFAMELGVMNGTGDGNFSPQEPLTIEQAIVIFYRLCQKIQVPGTVPFEKANIWLDKYRMNREQQFFAGDYLVDPNAGDISIYYGGFADGISTISIDGFTVDGIGTLWEPIHEYSPDGEKDYKAVFHGSTHDMQKGSFYTANADLTLTMNDGTTQQITDTFVFMY